MAGLFEMNSFVGKFARLWQSGSDATLKIECKAGKAVASLQLDLGYPHPPPHYKPVPSPVVRAAQVRRRQRRAAERQVVATAAAAVAAAEREQAEAVEAVEAEQDRVVTEEAQQEHGVAEQAKHENLDAEQADHEHQEAEQAEQRLVQSEEIEVVNEISAAEATDYNCDLCDRQFSSLRALRTHQARMHKASAVSPIPQIDGGGEDFGNNVTFTFVSEYALEDIEYTVREIFPDVETNLLSRVKLIGPWSADHLCTLEINLSSENFSWPELSRCQKEVLKDIQQKQ